MRRDKALQGKIIKIYEAIKNLFKIERRGNSKPLDTLIATILSQNTNDLNSHRAFENLKRKFPTYEAILNADLREVEEAIKIGGLAHQKAVRIKKLLSDLKLKRGNFDLSFLKDLSVEDGMKFLTSFKGIGLKTASCVLLFSFNKNIFPVDTHIHRILNRVGVVKTKSADETFLFLKVQHLIPAEVSYQLHTGLIKFGRLICRAREPLCGLCPIYKICEFDMKKFFREKSKGLKIVRGVESEFILLDEV